MMIPLENTCHSSLCIRIDYLHEDGGQQVGWTTFLV